MLRDRVLFTGTSSVSHPVLDHLFGGPLDPPKDAKVRDIGGHLLVVVDARLGSADLGEDGFARKALDEGVPVLIVSPNEGQLDPLASVIGAVPQMPAQAIFIAPNRNRKEKTRFSSTLLAYPASTADLQKDSKDTPPIKGDDKRSRAKAKDGCGCGSKGETAQKDSALAHYVTLVESQLTRGFEPAPLSLPDGLKYLQTTWTNVTYFTSSGCDDDDHCFANGQGSTTISYVIWGFLNQTSSSNSQYLIIEATYGFNPGSLAGNDDETVGWVNTLASSSVGPTTGGFAAVNHIPTNGVNSWTENFSINISYQNPLGGGYQIYTYTANVNQSIQSWSVQNASSGTSEGSQWFVNSPLNGSNLQNDWDDAFTTWGHVNPFPSASTGTLTANEVSAWLTNTIQSGNVSVGVSLFWNDTVFYSTSCGLLMCYKMNVMWYNRSWNPSFSVNFSTITP